MDQPFMGLNTRSLVISALIAGVAIGILSHLPLISCLNCLLYGWVWGGAIGAVFLYRRSQNLPALSVVQGLVIGVAAGVVGAIVAGGIASAIFGGLNVALQGLLNGFTQNLGGTFSNLIFSTGFSIFGTILDIILYAIFGAVGGIIATGLIWKAPTGPVPPYTPPPSSPVV